MAQELFNCIQAADMDLRPDFYKHIVLSGGTTMLPGILFPTPDPLEGARATIFQTFQLNKLLYSPRALFLARSWHGCRV